MSSEEQRDRRRRRMRRLMVFTALGLAGAAVVQELGKPERKRTWTGRVGGFVPYDLRWPPTAERLRAALWNPDTDALLTPHAFGVGWSVNLAEVTRQLRLALDVAG